MQKKVAVAVHDMGSCPVVENVLYVLGALAVGFVLFALASIPYKLGQADGRKSMTVEIVKVTQEKGEMTGQSGCCTFFSTRSESRSRVETISNDNKVMFDVEKGSYEAVLVPRE